MILETDLWSPNAHTRLYTREHAHTYTPTHVKHHCNSVPNQFPGGQSGLHINTLSQRPAVTAEAARYHESDPQYCNNVPDLNQAKP